MLGAALLLGLPGTAGAQSAYCRFPDPLPRPQLEQPEARRFLPIGGYTLALSWSPQYCLTARGPASALQCSGSNGRFGFILHGLWPEGVGKEWPQYCRPVDILPRKVIRENLCTTPSAQLLQHEWTKHGSCMATRPELYFNLARAFYEAIRFPDMTALARRKSLTVGDFTTSFARANKGLRADAIRVVTTRDGSLSEVRLCMDKAMEFARCPKRQPGANARAILRIQPGPNIRPTRRMPPTARPGLKLDLDPNAQVPAN
jgi:ribonuclease T2